MCLEYTFPIWGHSFLGELTRILERKIPSCFLKNIILFLGDMETFMYGVDWHAFQNQNPTSFPWKALMLVLKQLIQETIVTMLF